MLVVGELYKFDGSSPAQYRIYLEGYDPDYIPVHKGIVMFLGNENINNVPSLSGGKTYKFLYKSNVVYRTINGELSSKLFYSCFQEMD
jgi:hypothetical protein